MKPVGQIEKLIKQVRYKTDSATHERILNNVMQEMDKSQKQSAGKNKPAVWSNIMKNPITKLAAAAVIIIAVLVISMPFSKSGVAWGALAEKIESVHSVVYNITSRVKMQGIPQEQIPKTTAISYHSSEYGSRVENYINDQLSFIMYLNPKENVYLTVIPESKTFMKVTNKSQEELQRISDGDDPRVMVRLLLSSEYKHLGRDKINGIEVEGIEYSGPKVLGGMLEEGTARLWVEVGTDFPVRFEIEGIVSGGQMEMKMIMDDFQWNVDLDPALFVPDIKSDYTSQNVNIPETSEGTAINGLKAFAEITNGRYPSNLALLTLLKEVSEVFGKKYGIEITQAQGFTSELQEYSSALQDIIAAGTFFAQLQATGKEAVYYGDTVTAADSGKVLLRWKVSGEVYRVVFADLSTGNVSAEELAELEK